jgi:hypothetical protein
MSEFTRQIAPLSHSRRKDAPVSKPLICAVLFFVLAALLPGCGHLRPSSAEYVYVTVKQMYLHDRVAVVANRVAEVNNGERLRVLEHGRRFLRVETPQGAQGWIEEHAVIDQSQFDEFQNLAKQHANQTPVATAVLYSELYMHLEPGRKTQRFTLLPPNTKVAMLERASVPRFAASSVLGLPPTTPKTHPAARHAKVHKESFESRFVPAVPMEDWWLVRDNAGHTGWMVSRDFQVDVPEDVAQYAENERMVGAYVLRTVQDPDSGKPNGQVPEYLTVLTPYKEGLPYDFDQVRVFTWDTRRHRYGTAFRLRDVAGFFPVKVVPGDAASTNSPAPVFSFQVAAGDAVSLDPETGSAHAAQLETMMYRMERNLVRRVLPAGASAAPEARQKAPARFKHAGSHRSRRK